MKPIRILSEAMRFASLSLALMSTTALAGNTVIGMSFSGDPAELRQEAKALARFLTREIQPGEQATIINLDDLSEIGTMSVPNKAAYAAPKAKLNANKAMFRAVFAAAKSASGGAPSSNDIAGFLGFVARNHPSGGDDRLVILSQPIHHDEREPAHSMESGRVPGDGHTLTSRARSPYGAQGAEESLSGYRVIIGGGGDDWHITDQHAFFTEQFWAQNIMARGGGFLGLVDDRQALLQLAANPNARVMSPPTLSQTE